MFSFLFTEFIQLCSSVIVGFLFFIIKIPNVSFYSVSDIEKELREEEKKRRRNQKKNEKIRTI